MKRRLLLVVSMFIMIFLLISCEEINNEEFKVSFIDEQQQTIYEDVKVKINDKVSKPEEPVIEGYNFIGWFLGDIEYDFDSEVTKDLVLVAKYEIMVFTVIYQDENKEELFTFEVDYGNTFEVPTAINIAGYDGYWNIDLTDVEIKQDYVVGIYYQLKTFTISFEVNGGSLIDTIRLAYNSNISLPAEPKKNDYVFVGWYLDSEFEVPFSYETMPAENLTLYAKWVDASYTVTFIVDGEEFSEEVNYNDSVNFVNVSKIGYIFVGWYKDDILFDLDTEITEDITLVARFIPTVLTIFYLDDNGDLIEIVEVDYGQEIEVVSLPSKVGYTAMWSIDLRGVNITESLVVSLIYVINEYTISFEVNGGSYVADINFDYLETTVAPTEPTKDGYTFVGWYSDATLNTPYTFTTMPAENIVLYAKWQVTVTRPVFNESYDDIIHNLGTTFVVPVVTAYDEAGSVNVIIYSNNVNVNKEGVYQVIYKASNSAGDSFYTITVEVISSGILPYYNTITASPSNPQLFMNQLNLLISVVTAGNGKQNVSYDQVRQLLIISDRNPLNPNYLIGMYDQKQLRPVWDSGATWNREHVWPQSLLTVSASGSGRNMASDPHNLRAIDTNTNSSRGNKYFDNFTSSTTYFPSNQDKGDVARILLYMVTRYTDLSLASSSASRQMGNLKVLYDWHIDDPVDALERQRNDVIEDWQGNRNPYIDNPEWFYPVWAHLMDKKGYSYQSQAAVIASYIVISQLYDPRKEKESLLN